jgi:hypothetical protein
VAEKGEKRKDKRRLKVKIWTIVRKKVKAKEAEKIVAFSSGGGGVYHFWKRRGKIYGSETTIWTVGDP